MNHVHTQFQPNIFNSTSSIMCINNQHMSANYTCSAIPICNDLFKPVFLSSSLCGTRFDPDSLLIPALLTCQAKACASKDHIMVRHSVRSFGWEPEAEPSRVELLVGRTTSMLLADLSAQCQLCRPRDISLEELGVSTGHKCGPRHGLAIFSKTLKSLPQSCLDLTPAPRTAWTFRWT